MPVHPYFDPDHLYFVTTNAASHARLFKRESMIRILLNSVHFLRTGGRMMLFVFSIIPNHIHFIARFNKEYTLADVM